MSQDSDMSGGFDGDQVLVAEYVLGLLSAAEHAVVARRIAAEPRLAAEQRLWMLRLASLDSQFADVPAPAGALNRIETRLYGSTQASGGWWNSLAVWRSLAAGGLAIAVLAVGFNVMQPRVDPNVIATQLVAALQAQEGSGVEFVAFYDTQSGSVRLLGLADQALPENDFELWYIKGDEPAVSMGVVPGNERMEIPLNAVAKSKFAEGTVLAVTLEQKGGSPTGAPQGAIVAAGKATPI